MQPEAAAAAAAAQEEAAAQEAEEEAAAHGGALQSDAFAAALPTAAEAAEAADDAGREEQPWLADAAWQRLQAAGRRQGWLVDPEEVVLGEVIGRGTFGELRQATPRQRPACPAFGGQCPAANPCPVAAIQPPPPSPWPRSLGCRRGAPRDVARRVRGGQARGATHPRAGHHVRAGGGGAEHAAPPARHAGVCWQPERWCSLQCAAWIVVRV